MKVINFNIESNNYQLEFTNDKINNITYTIFKFTSFGGDKVYYNNVSELLKIINTNVYTYIESNEPDIFCFSCKQDDNSRLLQGYLLLRRLMHRYDNYKNIFTLDIYDYRMFILGKPEVITREQIDLMHQLLNNQNITEKL